VDTASPSVTVFTERVYKYALSSDTDHRYNIHLHCVCNLSKRHCFIMSYEVAIANGGHPSDATRKIKYANGASATQKLERLVSLAEDFATDQEAKKVLNLVGQTASLLDNVQIKEEQLTALKHEREAVREQHKTFNAQQLETYNNSNKKLKEQLDQHKAEIRKLENDVAHKDSALDESNATDVKSKREIELLQKLANNLKVRVAADTAKIAELENLCTKTRDLHDSATDQLQQEENQHMHTKSNLQRLQHDFEALDRQHSLLDKQWQLAKSLRVDLRDEDADDL
jgi:chromosome segregation ATPase